jgi:HEPN domain-containing protein
MMRESFFGMTEQKKAGKHRLDDARALLKAARWRGAMYMAGYGIECLLKTKLMRLFECRHLRELEEELLRRRALPARATVFTHQLEMLLRLAMVMDRLRQNNVLWRDFNVVNRWVPAWRYTADLSNREDAEDFVQAVDKVSKWIEHNT